MKSQNKTIEFLIDELNKCTQRLSVLEVEISNFNKRQKEYQTNLALISKKNLYHEIVNTITQLVYDSIILEDVIEYTVDILNKRISKIYSASIYFIEDDYAVLNAQKGYTEHYLNHFTNIPYPEGFTWRTLEEEKSIYVSDTSNDSSILNIGKKMGIKSYISTPIIISGKTLGTLTINSLHSEAFDQDEINLLNMISSLIVNAVNKKEIKNKII